MVKNSFQFARINESKSVYTTPRLCYLKFDGDNL